jgi:lipid-binding SYLF domain-containing protein
MNATLRPFVWVCALGFAASAAVAADVYEDAITAFRNAGESGNLFHSSAGYAIFPTVAKGGLGVGAAHGNGRVYRNDERVGQPDQLIGDAQLTQVSIGLQAGGQAYSEIIFFQDQAAMDKFTAGNFEMGAGVNATVITMSAGAKTSTAGSSAHASGSQQEAAVAGTYHNGMAVFTIPKGGLMGEATIAGQKFSFTPSKVATK